MSKSFECFASTFKGILSKSFPCKNQTTKGQKNPCLKSCVVSDPREQLSNFNISKIQTEFKENLSYHGTIQDKNQRQESHATIP
jgi:hypothetical protein